MNFKGLQKVNLQTKLQVGDLILEVNANITSYGLTMPPFRISLVLKKSKREMLLQWYPSSAVGQGAYWRPYPPTSNEYWTYYHYPVKT